MKKILGMGNALVDIIIPIEHDDQLVFFDLPKGSMQLVNNEKAAKILAHFSDSKNTIASGGSASNTINGLANLGIETGFVGMIGKDQYGDFFRHDQLNHGIHPHLIIADENSGTAITLMSPDAERTFATYLGAAVNLNADLIDPTIWKDYDILHIEGYLLQNYDLILTAVKQAKENGLKVSLDMASFNIVEEHHEFLAKIIENYVDIIFANEDEAKAFTGKSPEESLDILSEMCDYAIVKVGKDGSFVKSKTEKHHIQAVSNVCIDANGAGDGYAAGFLYGLVSGLPLEKCGEIGALVAGHVIQTTGPKLSKKQWETLIALIK